VVAFDQSLANQAVMARSRHSDSATEKHDWYRSLAYDAPAQIWIAKRLP